MSKNITPPSKLTIGWLINNLSLSVWASLIGSAVTIFSAGAVFGNSQFLKQMLGSEEAKEFSSKSTTELKTQLEGANRKVQDLENQIVILQDKLSASKNAMVPLNSQVRMSINTLTRMDERYDNIDAAIPYLIEQALFDGERIGNGGYHDGAIKIYEYVLQLITVWLETDSSYDTVVSEITEKINTPNNREPGTRMMELRLFLVRLKSEFDANVPPDTTNTQTSYDDQLAPERLR